MTARPDVADRRPLGLRQVQRLAGGRPPARPRLPRHRRDVPRGDLVVPRGGVDLTDEDAVAAAARELPLEMGTDPATRPSWSAAPTSTTAIRTTEVSTAVSAVATNRQVRPVLQQLQRDLMARIAEQTGGVVAEGRDITTVVAPDADVRVLLTAWRRPGCAAAPPSCTATTDESAVEATRDQVVRRDRDDSTVSDLHRGRGGRRPPRHLRPRLRAERPGGARRRRRRDLGVTGRHLACMTTVRPADPSAGRPPRGGCEGHGSTLPATPRDRVE